MEQMQRCAIDDDYPSFRDSSEEPKTDPVTSLAPNTQSEEDLTNASYVDVVVEETSITTDHQEDMEPVDANVLAPFDLGGAQELGHALGVSGTTQRSYNSKHLNKLTFCPESLLQGLDVTARSLLQGPA
ncbi:hypothetical protein RHMOL_Rhmol05G0017300 [Rhododendron molle]|uniref:Uncharacterized protein n=1 Tax=Rhododendron molle TaxID=49168 RepID=A0ACC0NLK1_RHOML|nr:hypothetical protein RHMOL_Rhmol05G0017300 [Rhododendron molle]